jgi:hypothetical protein
VCIYKILCDSIFAVSIINQESSIKKRIEMKKVILTLALVFTALSAVANPASVVATTSFGIESEVLSLDPVFKRKGEKLLVSFLNAEQVMVEIKVLDSQNNVIYTERVAGDLIVEKAFDFSKAFNDSYKIVVAYNQNAFEQIVKVQ